MRDRLKYARMYLATLVEIWRENDLIVKGAMICIGLTAVLWVVVAVWRAANLVAWVLS